MRALPGALRRVALPYLFAWKRAPPLRARSLVTGRQNDGRIRETGWPCGEPPAGFFDISGPPLGRSETPQPIGHSRDLTVMHVDLAMFCRHQCRHDWVPLL
jgi:hypothetical protein